MELLHEYNYPGVFHSLSITEFCFFCMAAGNLVMFVTYSTYEVDYLEVC